jgi:Fe2+ transport system protein FeoA
MERNDLIPLALMSPGESGVLSEIRGLRHHGEANVSAIGGSRRYRRRGTGRHSKIDSGHRLEHRLNYMGLLPGEQVKVIQNSPANPVIIAVKGSRLVLSRGIAFHLIIKLDGEANGEC